MKENFTPNSIWKMKRMPWDINEEGIMISLECREINEIRDLMCVRIEWWFIKEDVCLINRVKYGGICENL